MRDTDEGRDPIPEEFKSEDEAADFWESHSLAQYEEYLEPVQVDVDIQHRRFEIEVDERVFQKLGERAKTAHTSVKDLASRLLSERLATA